MCWCLHPQPVNTMYTSEGGRLLQSPNYSNQAPEPVTVSIPAAWKYWRCSELPESVSSCFSINSRISVRFLFVGFWVTFRTMTFVILVGVFLYKSNFLLFLDILISFFFLFRFHNYPNSVSFLLWFCSEWKLVQLQFTVLSCLSIWLVCSLNWLQTFNLSL